MSDEPQVTPVAGEPTRFLVASDAGKPPYLVDLRPYEGNGSCGCPNFTCRLEPKLVAGERDWSEEQRYLCKHLKRARMVFVRAIILVLDKNS